MRRKPNSASMSTAFDEEQLAQIRSVALENDGFARDTQE